jgi:fibronectin type 3 domain-containing protein
MEFIIIAAKNSNGESLLSDSIGFKPGTIPSRINNLTAIPGLSQNSLNWSHPESNGGYEIIGYAIYRGKISGNENLLRVVGNITSYNDTGLVNGQKYYYKVRALNSIGEGPFLQVAATTFDLPYTPLELTYESGVNFVYLEWSPPEFDGDTPISNYFIYRRDRYGYEELIKIVRNKTFYFDVQIKAQELYYYRISAKNIVGEGPKSVELRVVTEKKGIYEPGQKPSFLLPLLLSIEISVIIFAIIIVFMYNRYKKKIVMLQKIKNKNKRIKIKSTANFKQKDIDGSFEDEEE